MIETSARAYAAAQAQACQDPPPHTHTIEKEPLAEHGTEVHVPKQLDLGDLSQRGP